MLAMTFLIAVMACSVGIPFAVKVAIVAARVSIGTPAAAAIDVTWESEADNSGKVV